MQKENQDRLKKQLAFSVEIDKEKEIFRQTYLADASRKENDAEHAWHAAIMTYLLAEHANEKFDVAKTMLMLLIHDIVEVDAGDTYAYDEIGKQTQAQRETKAADRLYGMLPKDQGEKLRALWDEFEEGTTPEARFARVMDNLQPMMLNVASDGKAWAEHSVVVSKILNRNKKTPLGSEILWDYAKENWIKPHVKSGNVIDDIGFLDADLNEKFAPLEKNIIDVLKEYQVKLGYQKEKVRLYYPLSSLNHFLKTEETISGMIKLLQQFCNYTRERLGQLEISNEGERFCFCIQEDGVTYVHENMREDEFIKELVNLIQTSGCSIEKIKDLFVKHAGDKTKVHFEKMDSDEFDYLIYFKENEQEPYYYCFKDEGCHIIYHRYLPEDYKDFGF